MGSNSHGWYSGNSRIYGYEKKESECLKHYNTKIKGGCMMFRNQVSLFVAAFLIIGFFFLALPEKGFSQDGCCQSTENTCFNIVDGGGPAACLIIDFVDGAFCSEGQCIPPTVVTPIPTLSEWGLIAMAGILGIVGFMVIRRRKVTV